MTILDRFSQRLEVMGLIAYDCNSDKSDISMISLREVAQCPEPKSAYQSEKVHIQVLQRKEVELQHVWSCLIEVTRLITYCGMHSHSSVVAGGLLNFIYRVGGEECRYVNTPISDYENISTDSWKSFVKWNNHGVSDPTGKPG